MDNRVPFPSAHRQQLGWAGGLLGFASGGFFDGILLHQILQWHHLLSGIERAPFGDLRVQILADGLFHAAMYVIAAAGLWKLLQARCLLVDRSRDRVLAADALLGFGAWHVLDSLLSHWLLGLHRIRMDVPNPLFWDLLWFVVFGLLPVAAGIALRRRSGPRAPGGKERRATRSTLAPALAVAVAAAALASSLAPAGAEGTATTTVLLRPGSSPAQLLAALPATDARVVWSSRDGTVWVFANGKRSDSLAYYRHGAMYVSGTLLPAGCSAGLRF